MSTRTRFEKEANGNSEMAYCVYSVNILSISPPTHTARESLLAGYENSDLTDSTDLLKLKLTQQGGKTTTHA